MGERGKSRQEGQAEPSITNNSSLIKACSTSSPASFFLHILIYFHFVFFLYIPIQYYRTIIKTRIIGFTCNHYRDVSSVLNFSFTINKIVNIMLLL